MKYFIFAILVVLLCLFGVSHVISKTRVLTKKTVMGVVLSIECIDNMKYFIVKYFFDKETMTFPIHEIKEDEDGQKYTVPSHCK